MEAPAIDAVTAAAYQIPTDAIESDGTFVWDSTTLVLAQVHAAGIVGLGYTYGAAAVVPVVHQQLRAAVLGRSAFDRRPDGARRT